MPEFIIVNGKRQYRPGIPGNIDASALGGRGIATGVLAIVGALPSFESDVPTLFNSARGLRAFDPADPDLALLGKMAFSPSTQTGINGCERLYIVNVQPNTQASRTFNDSDPKAALTFKSKVWGTKGNRVHYDMTVASGVATSLTLTRDGITEEYTDLGSGTLATISDTTAGAIWTREVFPSLTNHNLHMSGIIGTFDTGVLVVVVGAVAQIRIADQLTVTPSAGSASDINIIITGLDDAGAAATETLTWTGGGGFAAKTTTHTWSSITNVTGSASDSAYTGVFDFSFDTLNIDPTTLSSLADFIAMVDEIGGGWAAEVVDPKASSVAAYEIDMYVSDVSAADWDITANLWAIIEGLSGSSLVEASRATALSDLPPVDATYVGNLLGGSVTTPITTTHWDDAFATLLEEDVQVIVPLSNSVTIHQSLIAHCAEAATNETERCGWVGCTADQTLANIKANWTNKLNSRHVALVGQSIEIVHPATNKTVELEPYYYALMHAAAQCGTPVATPLTRKRLAVDNVLQNWNPKLDLDQAISYGIAATDYDNLGWRINRDVTTYLTDDNPVFSQVSANESVNTSIRDLRARLDILIGNPSTTVTANGLKGIVDARLAEQVKAGIIRNYRNIVIVDGGSKYEVSYEAAPVEPILWITLNLTAVRIATTA